MRKQVAERLLRMAKILMADMTWEECIADAKKTGKRSPEKFCGWLRWHGPNAPKNSSVKEAKWRTVRKDIDPGMRTKEVKDSLTSYAPSIGKELRADVVEKLAQQGYELRPRDLKKVWSLYLAYVDLEKNNNKYHYYAIYSFLDSDGRILYVGANCNGRIGYVERTTDLTRKHLGGPVTSEQAAQRAIDVHMKEKLRKGYKPMPMIRG